MNYSLVLLHAVRRCDHSCVLNILCRNQLSRHCMCVCSTIWFTLCLVSQGWDNCTHTRAVSTGPGLPQAWLWSPHLGVPLCHHRRVCWGRGTLWLHPLKNPVHIILVGSANLYCKNRNTWGTETVFI